MFLLIASSKQFKNISVKARFPNLIESGKLEYCLPFPSNSPPIWELDLGARLGQNTTSEFEGTLTLLQGCPTKLAPHLGIWLELEVNMQFWFFCPGTILIHLGLSGADGTRPVSGQNSAGLAPLKNHTPRWDLSCNIYVQESTCKKKWEGHQTVMLGGCSMSIRLYPGKVVHLECLRTGVPRLPDPLLQRIW